MLLIPTDDFLNSPDGEKQPIYFNVAVVTISVFLFIFSIILISSSIKSFGYSLAAYTQAATSNPFIGLFIGLLSTALLQSSSTTTTITVAAVASGSISLEGAIPIILGANIGTTITSTIVSMGYITQNSEFRKAIAAATVHDFFNILMVLIVFPLEINYHILQNASYFLTNLFEIEELGIPRFSFTFYFKWLNSWLIERSNGLVMLLFAVVLLFICIKFISSLLLNILIGKTKKQFETTIFNNTAKSFGWGLLLTSIVQSSTLTTSLIVPLVATSKVQLRRAFQFILGANIGTTITALLAATFQSGAAVQLAVVHLLFNTLGVLIFLLIPNISKIPIFLASKLAAITMRMRIIGFSYILFAFFLVPFSLIYFSKGFEKKSDPKEVPYED